MLFGYNEMRPKMLFGSTVVDKTGLERIGNLAFRECESFSEVEMPSTVNVIDDGRLGLKEGLERIGEVAFFECESRLTEVDKSFHYCQVNIPPTVKVVDDPAFHNCKHLERFVLNEGLEQIGEEAFFECFSLSQFRIPQTVNSIASNAITRCRSLISIELPEESSFNIDLSGCRSLVNVVGQISTPVHREEFFRSLVRSLDVLWTM
eukprot:scaffold2127_cov85-Cylindrotheca_fusiformis.AAC.2